MSETHTKEYTAEEMLAMAAMAESAVIDDSGGSEAFAVTAAMLRQAAKAAIKHAQFQLAGKPTCATCKYWMRLSRIFPIPHKECAMYPIQMPEDGSGYCSHYLVVRKATQDGER